MQRLTGLACRQPPLLIHGSYRTAMCLRHKYSTWSGLLRLPLHLHKVHSVVKEAVARYQPGKGGAVPLLNQSQIKSSTGQARLCTAGCRDRAGLQQAFELLTYLYNELICGSPLFCPDYVRFDLCWARSKPTIGTGLVNPGWPE